MDQITLEDFQKIDMRVGQIIDISEFPRARNPSYQLLIDFGTEIGQKRSSAAIQSWYDHEDLLGRRVVAVINFPARQIANFFSEVLVLGSVDEKGRVHLLDPGNEAPLGSRVA